MFQLLLFRCCYWSSQGQRRAQAQDKTAVLYFARFAKTRSCQNRTGCCLALPFWERQHKTAVSYTGQLQVLAQLDLVWNCAIETA